MARKTFEGTERDEREDKQLASERGETMEQFEASAADAKHDRQGSMKGLHAVQAPNRPKGGRRG